MLKINKKIILLLSLIFLITICILYVNIKNKNKNEFLNDFNEESTDVTEYNKLGLEQQNNANKVIDYIYVHIIGEIKSPGLIKLKDGARIVDAIDAAGGITENADLNKVNLAFILNDGCKLRIPKVGEENETIVSMGDDYNVVQEGINVASGGKININTATQAQLETVTGIGPSTAAKIIEYRKQNGKFSKIDDIKNISGIGEEKFNNIKNQITIK